MPCTIWYTKRQATVESAVFGAEFVAMKQAMEVSRGLRYKLRMMGVPIEGPLTCMGTICQQSTTLNALNLSLRRNPTVSIIMLLERK